MNSREMAQVGSEYSFLLINNWSYEDLTSCSCLSSGTDSDAGSTSDARLIYASALALLWARSSPLLEPACPDGEGS